MLTLRGFCKAEVRHLVRPGTSHLLNRAGCLRATRSRTLHVPSLNLNAQPCPFVDALDVNE
jgi:hypothetical protein